MSQCVACKTWVIWCVQKTLKWIQAGCKCQKVPRLTNFIYANLLLLKFVSFLGQSLPGIINLHDFDLPAAKEIRPVWNNYVGDEWT